MIKISPLDLMIDILFFLQFIYDISMLIADDEFVIFCESRHYLLLFDMLFICCSFSYKHALCIVVILSSKSENIFAIISTEWPD